MSATVTAKDFLDRINADLKTYKISGTYSYSPETEDDYSKVEIEVSNSVANQILVMDTLVGTFVGYDNLGKKLENLTIYGVPKGMADKIRSDFIFNGNQISLQEILGIVQAFDYKIKPGSEEIEENMALDEDDPEEKNASAMWKYFICGGSGYSIEFRVKSSKEEDSSEDEDDDEDSSGKDDGKEK